MLSGQQKNLTSMSKKKKNQAVDQTKGTYNLFLNFNTTQFEANLCDKLQKDLFVIRPK